MTEIAVVVPAADEEQRIGACLTAVSAAINVLRAARPHAIAHVVVVLDACRDRTADIVARHENVEAVVSTARNVGVARGLGTAHAVIGAVDRTQLWLANTDADSLVAPTWLLHQVAAADAGHDLVLGTVRPGPELNAAARRAWDRYHDLADDHHHIHGANLGVRATALEAVGGWPALATGEDIDLVRRAERAGLRILRTGAAPVITSARRLARAPEGFSSYLRQLDADVVPIATTGLVDV